ncbi:MAG: glycosyltransferase family 87 protein [Chloroflexota bacterium]
MLPPQPYLPYVYAPWSVPLFLPWALLPWDVAWILWRGINVLLLVWSAAWAYQRHPLATAILLCVLAAPIAATLDTGNLTLLCALGVWAAQFTGPRLGGGLWALATVLKWFPAPLWLILPPRARLWGLIWMGIAGVLALATWSQTLVQVETAVTFPRPFRLDYLLLLWAAVPWIWARPRLLDPAQWRPLASEVGAWARMQWSGIRTADQPGRAAVRWVGRQARALLGLELPASVPDAPAATAPPAPTG